MSSTKRKLLLSNEENKKKKKASGNVWSEKDEIALLKGVIDYEEMNQASPYADMGKFFDFVKGFLHIDVQRKQLTNRLWKLKNRYVTSGFDILKPHHEMLLELSKSIKCWGEKHADVSGGESGNVVSGDDGNGEKDGVDVDKLLEVVVSLGKGKVGISGVREGRKDDVGVEKSLKMVRNKEKGKIVTRVGRDGGNGNVAIDGDVCVDNVGVEKLSKEKGKVGTRVGQDGGNDNVAVDGDVRVDDVGVDKLSKVVKNKGKGKVGTRVGQEAGNDNVAVDDDRVDDVGVDKLSKVVKNKGKGKVGTWVGQEAGNDNAAVDGDRVDDVGVDKLSKVVKNKEKWKVGTRVGRDGEKDKMIVDDVCKFSKMVKNKEKGKIASREDGQDGENDKVAIDGDVHANMGLEVVKKKRKFVNGGAQNVKEVDVILDDINGRKSSKVVENKKKGKVVTCDGQTTKGDDVVVEDVAAARADADQNVGDDNVVVNEVLAGEANKKVLKYSTSVYPELSKVLELETLSRMPQHIRKKCVMDTINSMGREKANILEEKWADLRLMELELHAKKLDLTNKQINLILEAARANRFLP